MGIRQIFDNAIYALQPYRAHHIRYGILIWFCLNRFMVGRYELNAPIMIQSTLSNRFLAGLGMVWIGYRSALGIGILNRTPSVGQIGFPFESRPLGVPHDYSARYPAHF